jgi:hypothetical protein
MYALIGHGHESRPSHLQKLGALHNVYHLRSAWQSYHPVHCRHASGSAEYHFILAQLLCALFF